MHVIRVFLGWLRIACLVAVKCKKVFCHACFDQEHPDATTYKYLMMACQHHRSACYFSFQWL
jgi:hypothetical protein